MSQIGKVKSFALNPARKRDIEKLKKKEEEEAAAEAYQEYVAVFEKPKASQLFVRGSVINAASGAEIEKASASNKFYKTDKLEEIERQKHAEQKKAEEKLRQSSSLNDKPPKKKGDVKKVSNLELFKEELKMIQEEREGRFRGKHATSETPAARLTDVDDADSRNKLGSHDTGDPNTTNIYLANISPKLTEAKLCETFGNYGPLASVKIMWPRTDDERKKNRNCGFVAFMCRKDAERAMRILNNVSILDYEMKLGWGKGVPIPSTPIYIPPALLELTSSPPPSGLPFNAQVVDENDKQLLEKFDNDPQRMFREDKQAFDDLLSRAVVKVVPPTDKTQLALIHRVIEFVIRDGPLFEAFLMNREANNQLYSFLFDNQSTAHIYYRWKLFSILNGDSVNKWRTEEFRMFENGSIWKPPPVDLYLQGMPEELLPKQSDSIDGRISPGIATEDAKSKQSNAKKDKKNTLSVKKREQLEDLLRCLNPQRSKIASAMMFCVENADASEEIIDCISDSLTIAETPLFKKIARLYLVSDILHNSVVKVANVSSYRKGFQSKMVPIFESIHQAYASIEGRLKAEQFKQRVMNCFRAWEETVVYSSDLLITLQNIFLGLVPLKSKQSHDDNIELDIDGVPIIDSDLDGHELDEDGQRIEALDETRFTQSFKPSKWEISDAEVKSKWETSEKVSGIFDEDEEDIDGEPLEDNDYFDSLLEKSSKVVPNSSNLSRDVLRDIELKVVKYQDSLDKDIRKGKFVLPINETVASLVEKYREELKKKALTENLDSKSSSKRDRSPLSPRSRKHSSSSSRKHSHSPRRSRSRSPKRRK